MSGVGIYVGGVKKFGLTVHGGVIADSSRPTLWSTHGEGCEPSSSRTAAVPPKERSRLEVEEAGSAIADMNRQ